MTDLAVVSLAIRKRLGLNQTQFARRIYVDQTTVSLYESSKINLSPAVLAHLLRYAQSPEERETIVSRLRDLGFRVRTRRQRPRPLIATTEVPQDMIPQGRGVTQ
jgi:transcriptional regulator with XRE-family HTH domain